MVDSSLVDNFLKNVPNPSRKYEHRNIMFTELIKEVLVSFSATQNVSTNQTSNKSQEKPKFWTFTSSSEEKITFPWGFHSISFASPFQVSNNHQPSTRHITLARNCCKKLFGLGLYRFFSPKTIWSCFKDLRALPLQKHQGQASN